MATTVATLITSLKYDLRNYGQMDFGEDLIVHYINRAINILDAKLIAWNSDQTLTMSTATLAKGYDYVTVPTRMLALREVWIQQDRKQAAGMNDLYYRRQFKKNVKESGDAIAVGDLCKTINQNTIDFSTKGAGDNDADTYWVCTVAFTMGASDTLWKFDGQEPTYFCHVKEQIQFEAAASAAKTCRLIYDIGSATVTADSSMPYSGTYDDPVREVVVQMSIHKKHKEDSPTDAVYAQIFDQVMTMDIVNRRFTRKQYKLDF
jgi:hypothetical protein